MSKTPVPSTRYPVQAAPTGLTDPLLQIAAGLLRIGNPGIARKGSR